MSVSITKRQKQISKRNELIRKTYNKRVYTLRDVAQMSGLSEAQISRICNGITKF